MNNMNQTTDLNSLEATTASHWLIKSFLGLVTFVAVFGNSVLIFVLLRRRSTRCCCPTHIFIASLASADLLLGLTVMVPRMAEEVMGKWPFGDILCQTFHAMDVTLCTASILHLSCVSIDRYFAIVNQPLLYPERMTTRNITLMILSCWTLSGLTGFVPVLTGIYSSPERLATYSMEHPQECNLVVNKYFSVIAGCISFWFPGTVMVLIYMLVYREAKRLQRQRNSIVIGQIRYSVDSRMSGFNDGISCNNAAAADNNHHSSSSMGGRSASAVTLLLAGVEERIKKAGGGGEIPQKKPLTDPIEESGVTLTVGIVMGAFVVCWLPFFIWMPLTALLELDTPDGVYSAILWIGYGNSAVNPVIYGVFSKEIREAIADEFARAKECCRKAGTVE